MIENVLREDLAPVESARAYQKQMAARNWSARQLAAELAIAPSTVTRALLELPAEVQDRVDNGSLPAHTAFEVTRLDDPGDQVAVAEIAVTQNLKRAEVGELVQAMKARRPAPEAEAPRPEPLKIDLGDAVVRITWKRGESITAIQALRRATRILQEQERSQDDQAA